MRTLKSVYNALLREKDLLNVIGWVDHKKKLEKINSSQVSCNKNERRLTVSVSDYIFFVGISISFDVEKRKWEKKNLKNQRKKVKTN